MSAFSHSVMPELSTSGNANAPHSMIPERSKRRRPETPMHVILVATQKGGAGKSTLSAHFGALADREGKTLLVDADPQGSLMGWYQSRNSETPLLVQADANSISGILDAAAAEDVEWVIIDSAP